MKTIKDYGIDHVGFVVKNLEETVQHFKDYYGIDEFKYWDFKPKKAWSYGKPVEGYRLKVAMGSLTNTGCCVEIIEPVSDEGCHHEFVKAGNSGLHHVAFKVEDFPYWREYFINKCKEFVFEAEIEDDVVGYRRCFYANDPEAGMIYEVREIPYFRK